MARHVMDIHQGPYRCVCACGHQGPVRATRYEALRDAVQHIRSLPAVPAEARCRVPETHHIPAWEPCGLCAGQMDLLDLDDVEVQ